MMLFVSIDGDGIGQQVGRARLSDNVEEIRRVDQAINNGNKLWESFVGSCGGSIIEIGGDEACFEIPPGALDRLPAIREQYADAVGASVSVGIGLKISESSKALMIAKLRGKDRIVFWAPELEKEIQAFKEKEPDEAHKLFTEYLDKAIPGMNEGVGAGFEGASRPSGAVGPTMAREGSPTQAIKELTGLGEPEEPEATHAEADYEKYLHDHAQDQDKKDQAQSRSILANKDHVRQQLAQILLSFKQQQPMMAQLKQAAPDTYASIVRLIQVVIELAKEHGGGDDAATPKDSSLGKSEDLGKMAIEDLGMGKAMPQGPNGEERFDYSHLLPHRAKERGYKMVVHHDDDINTRGGAFHVTVTAKNKRPAGYITGEHESGVRSISPNFTELDKEHRGQGIGLAMYEALFAHGKHYMSAEHVVGGKHSTAAHGIHKKLSDKHGMTYSASPTDNHDIHYPHDFDARYGNYNYHLKEEMPWMAKSEALEKMAMANIPVGKPMAYAKQGGQESLMGTMTTGLHDYSHVVPKEHQGKYAVTVGQRAMHNASPDAPTSVFARVHHLQHANDTPGEHNDVGVLTAYSLPGDKKTLNINTAELDSKHQQKGLGFAMYEALLSHSKNKLGFQEVAGDTHSTLAHRTQSRLAQKHGLNYQAEEISQNKAHNRGALEFDQAYGPYKYTLKAEMSMQKDSSAIPGMPKHHHLNLPVGSVVGKKIKIQHGENSKVAWRQVGAGMISSQDPGGVGGGATTHAVSSRTPGSS